MKFLDAVRRLNGMALEEKDPDLNTLEDAESALSELNTGPQAQTQHAAPQGVSHKPDDGVPKEIWYDDSHSNRDSDSPES